MIVIHHLNFSRSTRVLWLLEELGRDYELVRHERDATFRAPASLKAVHPLGKAPVIQDGALTLAESGTVLDYIDTRYGAGRLAPPAGSDEAWRHNEWLHYIEGSAGLPVMTTVLGAMTGGLPAGLGGFVDAELARTLDHVEAGVGDGPYLFGERFTLADIQLCYFLVVLRSLGKLASAPGLLAYLERCEARPAFRKAIEVGGPITPR